MMTIRSGVIVLSYKITVQPLAGEWTNSVAKIANKRNHSTWHDDKVEQDWQLFSAILPMSATW